MKSLYVNLKFFVLYFFNFGLKVKTRRHKQKKKTSLLLGVKRKFHNFLPMPQIAISVLYKVLTFLIKTTKLLLVCVSFNLKAMYILD